MVRSGGGGPRKVLRVGVVGLHHESNTFIRARTEAADFEVAAGEAVREAYAGSYHEVAGFVRGLEEEGLAPVPLVVAAAVPGGPISAPALESVLRRIDREVDRAGPLDGVLAAAHGAAVGEGQPDVDGHWLGRLRRRVGPAVPVVATVDAHANLSSRMVEASDALVAYRTNPHLDTFDRGVEAARLLARSLRGEVRLSQAAAFPPVAINVLLQNTSRHPCLPLYRLADALRERRGVLSVSICLGFPYADVPEMGTSFVAVTDGRPELARSVVEELAVRLVADRHRFVPELVGPEEAVDRAVRARGPVCLLDTGDNVGGGSPGDGTVLAHLIHRRGGPPAVVSLVDPASAGQAAQAGVGARLRLRMGGRADERLGPPLEASVTVSGLPDGRFTEPEVRHGGWTTYDMGRTAVVATDRGLTVQLTSRRVPPFSLNQLLSSGLDPRRFHIVVVKGVHAPLAAYQPVCPTTIWAATPGPATVDLGALKYRRRRRPLFPFEELTSTSA